jgi:hypothetical protein
MHLLVIPKHRFIDVLITVYCAYYYVTLYYGLLVMLLVMLFVLMRNLKYFVSFRKHFLFTK